LIFGSRGGEGGNQAGFIYHSPLPGQFTRSILMKYEFLPQRRKERKEKLLREPLKLLLMKVVSSRATAADPTES
jgi:hypothetical protein